MAGGRFSEGGGRVVCFGVFYFVLVCFSVFFRRGKYCYLVIEDGVVGMTLCESSRCGAFVHVRQSSFALFPSFSGSFITRLSNGAWMERMKMGGYPEQIQLRPFCKYPGGTSTDHLGAFTNHSISRALVAS